MFKVIFLPSKRVARARKDETLFSLARRAGVHLNTSCNGNGTCGKCQIKIEEGLVNLSPSTFQLPAQRRKEGYILACQACPQGEVTVFVPKTTRLIGDELLEERGEEIVQDKLRKVKLNPSFRKVFVKLPPPSLEDDVSDWQRLLRELRKSLGLKQISPSRDVLTGLNRILREGNWRVTVAVFRGRGTAEVVRVQPGKCLDGPFILAVDVGTTTLMVELIDLSNGKVLGRVSQYNPQMIYGEDVISRIIYTSEPDGLEKLQREVIKAVEGMGRRLIKEANLEPREVTALYLAGNTIMLHLLFGLDPSHIREEPYIPLTNFSYWARAGESGFRTFKKALVYALPCVASYLGADVVGGLVASGMAVQDELRLFIDIGTNGEMVLGNGDWFLGCSCSAGPAFEGGGVKHGMRAAEGAIEEVRMNPEGDGVEVVTLGDLPPVGLCGSGLIDLLAELFMSGIIDRRGKFHPTLRHPRVRQGESGFEFVVSPKKESGTGEDIVLTEADVDNLMRAKAAVFAGLRILLNTAKVDLSDLAKIYIGGSFGRYIDAEKAITIGLLPDLPLDKFHFLGNTSLLGARLVALSQDFWKETERVASKITYVQLATSGKFMDEYVSGLFLPHTHLDLFPSVAKKEKEAK